MQLSQHQQNVLDQILVWFNQQRSASGGFLRLGGFAGTGKTTLIAELRQRLSEEYPEAKVAFVAYTGKATRVMSEKILESNAKFSGDSVSTIHRLIYRAVTNSNGEVVGWERRELQDFAYKLIILDEASMVTKSIWQDLQRLSVPILAVGDHGQLPPVGEDFNLMENPDLVLEEIFRQEEDNPILHLSFLARTDGVIPHGRFGTGVRKIAKDDPDAWEIAEDFFRKHNSEMLILTGYNHTRNRINSHIRQLLEFTTSQPQVGDRVICLRNNHAKQIFNGMMGYITETFAPTAENPVFELEIEFDGEDKLYKGPVDLEQFGAKTTFPPKQGLDQFDFGYAITVHKAQGSQAKTVLLFEERFPNMGDIDWRRWLYTAVTRATDELYIIG